MSKLFEGPRITFFCVHLCYHFNSLNYGFLLLCTCAITSIYSIMHLERGRERYREREKWWGRVGPRDLTEDFWWFLKSHRDIRIIRRQVNLFIIFVFFFWLKWDYLNSIKFLYLILFYLNAFFKINHSSKF